MSFEEKMFEKVYANRVNDTNEPQLGNQNDAPQVLSQDAPQDAPQNTPQNEPQNAPQNEPANVVQNAATNDDQNVQQNDNDQLPEVELTAGEVSDADFIKSQFGVESIDELKSLVEAGRKNKQVSFADIAALLPNETSKKILELIVNDKVDELADILYTNKRMKEAGSKSDDELLKEYIRINNPLFDEEDVESKYKSLYSVSDDLEKWEKKEIEQRKLSDMKKAKEFFNSNLNNLQFPAIEGEEQKANETLSRYGDEFIAAVPEAKAAAANIAIEFSDKDAKISFPVKFVADAQGVQQAKEIAQNYFQFVLDRYFPNGKPNAEQLIADVYTILNRDKIIKSSVSQTYNQTRRAVMKGGKNIKDVADAVVKSPLVEDEYVSAVRKVLFARK